MKDQKISSTWTIPMLVIMSVLWVFMLPMILILSGTKFTLEGSHVFVLIIYLVLNGLTLYLTFSLAIVRLTENEIICKKLFRPEKRFAFDKIGYPKAFRYKRLKFTSVPMKNQNGTTEKFLILNNNAILSGERKDAEEILLSIRK